MSAVRTIPIDAATTPLAMRRAERLDDRRARLAYARERLSLALEGATADLDDIEAHFHDVLDEIADRRRVRAEIAAALLDVIRSEAEIDPVRILRATGALDGRD